MNNNEKDKSFFLRSGYPQEKAYSIVSGYTQPQKEAPSKRQLSGLVAGLSGLSSWRNIISHKKFLILAGIICYAYIIRLIVHLLDPVLTRDCCSYIYSAEQLFKNEGFQRFHQFNPDIVTPPFFLSMICSLMNFGISSRDATIAINIICGSITPVVAGGIAWELTQNNKMFWGVSFLTASHPFLIELSGYGQRDMPYILFAGCVLYFLLAGCRRNKFYLILSGVFLPISLLTRYESAEMIFISFIIILLAKYFIKFSWTTFFQYNLIVYASAFIVLCVYLWASESSLYLQDSIKHYNGRVSTVLNSHFDFTTYHD